MAVTSILTTEGEITSKEGANVSSSLTDQMHDDWVLQAETYVNNYARYNFSDNYAGLNVDVKYILSDVVSSLVAIQGIMYDPSGYTSLEEAKAKVDVLIESSRAKLAILRDKKVETFMTEA